MSKYRGKFNKVKEYYSNEDFTKMNEILSRISLRDKYVMKKVLNLTNDKTSIVTLEIQIEWRLCKREKSSYGC